MATRNIVTEGTPVSPIEMNKRFAAVHVVGAGAHGVAGDGNTDDRDALNALVNVQIDNEGGTVEFLEGTYRIGGHLTIPEHILLRLRPAAKIRPTKDAVITILGPFEAPLMQVFDLSEGGTVMFGERSVSRVVPQWWGAAGDGLEDDTEAIKTAEEAAWRAKTTLEFPPGCTFAVRGRLRVRSNVRGYGSTLRWLEAGSPSETLTNYDPNDGAATDIIIEGITVDANYLTRGCHLELADRVIVRDCTFKNCLMAGVAAYTSRDVMVENCKIEGVRYAVGATAADGIYFGGCERPVARNNRISDFRRIGIVAERNDTVKSVDPWFEGNSIRYGHDCDDTATEYNAGIWIENTNGGYIIRNYISDIGGNDGQTSGRVRGLTVGIGNDKNCAVVIAENVIEVGDAAFQKYAAVVIEGTGNYANVTLRDNIYRYCSIAISCSGGVRSVEVVGGLAERMTITSGGEGVYVHASSVDPDRVLIDGLDWRDITDNDATNNWAHLNFFSGGAKEVQISRVGISQGGAGLIIRSSNNRIESLTVRDSHILSGSAGAYGTFRGRRIFLSNVKVTAFGTRSTDHMFNYAGGGVAACVTHCTFEGVKWEFGSATGFEYDYQFHGCRFLDGTRIQSAVGSENFRLMFMGCFFDEYDATAGAIRSNFGAAPNLVLIVKNCHFRHSSDVTPLVVWVNEPGKVYLGGNTYETTNLHTFSQVLTDNGLVKAYSVSLSPTEVAAQTVEEQTFSVSGLSTADRVMVNPPDMGNAIGIAGARVSAADTLAISFVNPTSSNLTPASGTYHVVAVRP